MAVQTPCWAVSFPACSHQVMWSQQKALTQTLGWKSPVHIGNSFIPKTQLSQASLMPQCLSWHSMSCTLMRSLKARTSTKETSSLISMVIFRVLATTRMIGLSSSRKQTEVGLYSSSKRVGDELMLPREQIFKRKTPSVFVFGFILMMRN